MVVVRIDTRSPHLAMLTPILAQRVQAYALENQPEINAEEYASNVVARVWSGDPSLLALMILDPESGLPTGHLVAEVLGFGTQRWAQIQQLRADQNVGDARVEAVEQAAQWAKLLQCPQIMMTVHRDGREWEKKLGFKLVRHVLRLPLLEIRPHVSEDLARPEHRPL